MFVNVVPGKGNISHNENFPYVEGTPDRSTFLSLQVYERVGISPVEVYEKVGNLSFR